MITERISLIGLSNIYVKRKNGLPVFLLSNIP